MMNYKITCPRDAFVFEGVQNFDDFETVVLQIQQKECTVSSLLHLRQCLEKYNETENFIRRVLPIIVGFAKSVGPLFAEGIPVLRSTTSGRMQFSYAEVAGILSNFFLCTFTDRWKFDADRHLSPASLIRLFGPNGEEKEEADVKIAKIAMLYFGYFQRLEECVNEAARLGREHMSVYRNVSNVDTKFWSTSEVPIGKMKMVSIFL